MSDKTYRDKIRMTKEMWEDGITWIKSMDTPPRIVDVEMPKQGLNCIYKGTEEYRKVVAKKTWRDELDRALGECEKDILELTNEEKK